MFSLDINVIMYRVINLVPQVSHVSNAMLRYYREVYKTFW